MVKRVLNERQYECRTTVSWSSAYTAPLKSEIEGDHMTCYYGLVKEGNMHNCQVNLGSIIIDNRTRSWRWAMQRLARCGTQKGMVHDILQIQVIAKLLWKVIKWQHDSLCCCHDTRNGQYLHVSLQDNVAII